MATSTVRQLRVSAAQHGAYRTIGEALQAAPDDAVISIDAGEYAETTRIHGQRGMHAELRAQERQRSATQQWRDGTAEIIVDRARDVLEVGQVVVVGRGGDQDVLGEIAQEADRVLTAQGEPVRPEHAEQVEAEGLGDERGGERGRRQRGREQSGGNGHATPPEPVREHRPGGRRQRGRRVGIHHRQRHFRRSASRRAVHRRPGTSRPRGNGGCIPRNPDVGSARCLAELCSPTGCVTSCWRR